MPQLSDKENNVQMELDDQETMTIEEAREMTLAAVREEYAKL